MIDRYHLFVKLVVFFNRFPWWALILIGTSVIFVINILFSVTDMADDQISNYEGDNIIFVALFVSPLIETFLFQLLPIEIFSAVFKTILKKKYPIITIIIAGFLFAIAHRYNSDFIIFAFMSGSILAMNYYLFQRRKNWGHGYIMTFIQHFLVNLTSVAYNLI